MKEPILDKCEPALYASIYNTTYSGLVLTFLTKSEMANSKLSMNRHSNKITNYKAKLKHHAITNQPEAFLFNN